ncbi:hypothetical protein CC86DRAFT_208778 [Ophiobolus disseminans]|uniref:Uncharacterized protein n=1 Tax=Ophiobolus disseminans TaxID=1469910 RepID=A0A6A7A3H2_9PLEO|nr:hypothetical protein CC86DRAFT_208778 [Ophiobolus disseminans]
MAHNFDLTLPPTAPANYLSRDHPREGEFAALYTLIPLSEAKLREIASACEPNYEKGEDDIVRVAPEPHFISQPLRAVYDSFLELDSIRQFDPYYFVVVVHEDWRKEGLLLVNIYNDDEPPAIDSFFCKAEDVGSIVLNLQIGNTDWYEAREGYEVGVDNGEEDGDDDDEDKDDDDEGDKGKDDEPELPTDAGERQSEDEGPEYPSKKPTYDYLIPIYTLDSVDADAVISSLEEDMDDKPNPFTDYQIRHQASLKPTNPSSKDIKTLSKPDPLITEDLITQACALHPIRCRANKWLNKTYLLIVDTTSPSTSGLILVKLTWDHTTTGRTKASLHTIGTNAPRKTTRIPGTLDAIKYDYNMIATNTAIFARKHPAFAMFYINEELPFNGVAPVDAPHWDRKSRSEYFVPAWRRVHLPSSSSPQAPPEELEIEWTLPEAVSRFPWFCCANRFEPLLDRTYFIWFDHLTVEREGVVLVRYEWDRDVEKGEGELWDAREGKVWILRVGAGEAMERILKAEREGSEGWEWEAYGG